MFDRDRQIDELHQELLMLNTALELIHDPPARERIFARINACITQYTQLVDGYVGIVLSSEMPDE
jgi:hypothetical protein